MERAAFITIFTTASASSLKELTEVGSLLLSRITAELRPNFKQEIPNHGFPHGRKMMSDEVVAFWFWVVAIFVVVFFQFLFFFGAGLNSYQRHLCESQGYDWINEKPEEQPLEGPWLQIGVTCVEPITRVNP